MLFQALGETGHLVQANTQVLASWERLMRKSWEKNWESLGKCAAYILVHDTMLGIE